MRRFTRRRAADEPPATAVPGPDSAADSAPTEPAGRPSLLTDPAAAEQQPTQALPATRAEPPREAAGGASGAEPVSPVRAGATDADAKGVAETPAAGQVGAGEAAAPLPPSDLPAGIDPRELAAAPEPTARRSRMRRRIGFLRAAREVLLRDLGGFVFELHRTAHDEEREGHRQLRQTKLERLAKVDAELRELERRTGDVRRHVVVREPGLGGECPRCGELYGSDAHYCSHCGTPLTEPARQARAKVEGTGQPAPAQPAAPAPARPESETAAPGRPNAVVPAGPEPATGAERRDEPSAATPSGPDAPAPAAPPRPEASAPAEGEPGAPPAADEAPTRPGSSAQRPQSDSGPNGRPASEQETLAEPRR